MRPRTTRRFLGSAFVLLTIGSCTTEGGIDWNAVASVSGKILGVAAVNYPGPYVDTLHGLFTAFTEEEVPQPLEQGVEGMPGQYPTASATPPAFPDQVYVESDPVNWDTWGEPFPDQGDPFASSNDPFASSGFPQADPTYPAGGQQPATPAFEDPGSFPGTQQLVVDFGLVKATPYGLSALADGEILRDGVNRPESGDRFGISFTVNQPAYVYIVNIDATGWAQTLFPYPDVRGFDNPVQPGQQYLLPGESLYGLDDARGVETIMVTVSKTPNQQLEASLAPLRGRERSTEVGSRGAYARVSVPFVGQRGLTGIQPGSQVSQFSGSPSPNQQAMPASMTTQLDRFVSDPGANEVAFSRWINHQ